jgi:hypothetical protein
MPQTKKSPTKKRVRYKIPTYKKADKIIKNIKSYDANQKHIFRIKTLHIIHREIARELFNYQLTIPLLLEELILYRDGLSIFFETEKNPATKQWENYITAEVTGTENLPLKDRIKIHIKALRDIRAGKRVKKYKPKKDKTRKVA